LLKRITIYITLFWSFTCNAQYLSVRGDFSIDQRRGCRDLLLTVTNINPGTDVILYQYEGKGSTVTANSSFIYFNTGNFWLFQYIQGPTGQKVDSILVEILNPVIPDFELHACNNNDVQVDLKDNNYDIYEIDYGDGIVVQIPVNTFPPIHSYASSAQFIVTITGLYTTANNRCGSQSVNFTAVNQVTSSQINILNPLNAQSLIVQYSLTPNTISTLEISVSNTGNYQLFKNIVQGTQNDTITNLQLTSASYCFRIASHDACSNFKVYSNEICSIYADIEAVNNSIDLNWNTSYPVNFSSFIVIRDSVNLVTLLTPGLNYSDSSALCKVSYCYYMEVQHVDGSLSRSNEICATGFSTSIPSSVDNVSATITSSEILWSWVTPVNEIVKSYSILDQTGLLLDTTSQNSTSTSYTNDPLTCIEIAYTNSCDNISVKSSLVCPLIISKTNNVDGSLTLRWEAYNGWENGVNSYVVEIFDKNMNRLDSLDIGLQLDYTDPLPSGNNQVSIYQVTVQAVDNGLLPSISNILRIERAPIIAVPNTFTPNGDNLNDIFVVSGKFIESVEISILNRWGAIIYQVNGSSWDGTVNGKKVPLGNYIYQIIVKDFAGNQHIRNGTVLILSD